MDLDFLKQVSFQVEEQEVIYREEILDAFLIYYFINHEVNLEEIAKISSCSIAETKRELKSLIVQDPLAYDLEPDMNRHYVVNSDFIQGNLFELYSTTKALNQKYNHLFDRNLELLQKVIYEPEINLINILFLGKYLKNYFDLFLNENRLLVKQDGYKYTMENQRYERVVSNLFNRSESYFWQNNEYEMQQDIIIKLMQFLLQYQKEIKNQFGYTYFFPDSLEYSIALHKRTLFIHSNISERIKRLLLSANYLIRHHLHESVDVVVKEVYLNRIQELNKELNISKNVRIYSTQQYNPEKSECLFYDEYLENKIDLHDYERVILSSSLLIHDSYHDLLVYDSQISHLETNPFIDSNHYAIIQDHKYGMHPIKKLSDPYLYRRLYPYIHLEFFEIQPIYLTHSFKTSRNPKAFFEMRNYKMIRVLEMIQKKRNQKHLIYTSENSKLKQLFNDMNKADIQYIFHGEKVKEKSKVVISNLIQLEDIQLFDSIHYLDIPSLTEFYYYSIIQNQYLYLIEDSVDLVQLETLAANLYLTEEITNDYRMSNQFYRIINKGIKNQNYHDKVNTNHQQQEFMYSLELDASLLNKETEHFVYSTDRFTIEF